MLKARPNLVEFLKLPMEHNNKISSNNMFGDHFFHQFSNDSAYEYESYFCRTEAIFGYQKYKYDSHGIRG